jgi:nucleoside-diphosphate-sugar epimerase
MGSGTVFISGATGFLGGAVVMEALRRDMAHRLLLLVRGGTSELALRRVRDNLRGFGASDSMLASLREHQIFCADLDTISACADDLRLDTVSCVIHCAALATFSNNPALHRVNVEGTRALAHLMHRRPALQRFFFIGTAMACGSQTGVGTQIDEVEDLPLHDVHLVPYTRSKALAENMLRCEFPDLPVTVLRPSIIVGDTQRGCAASQSIFWVFLVAQMLGAFTVDLDAKVDVVPVDWCARAILDLAAKPVLQHKVYHLSADSAASVSFREVDQTLALARGVVPVAPTYRCIGVEELRSLVPLMRKCIPGCNERLLIRALQLYAGFATLNYVFRNEHFLGEGVQSPPRFTDYLARCVASTIDIPIAVQMAWDFK